MFTANPVSAILFPAVLSALNDAYGLRGAVLIYGALIMHISALCPVLKEPPWIAGAGALRKEGACGNHRVYKTSIDSTGCDMKLLAKSDEPETTAFSNEKILNDVHRHSVSTLKASTLSFEENMHTVKVALVEDDIEGRHSDCQCLHTLRTVSPALMGVTTSYIKRSLLRSIREIRPRLTMRARKCRTEPIFTASFVVAVVASTMVDYVNIVHIFTMMDYARDKGVSRIHATMSLTYAASLEIVGRLLVPLIADMGWLSRPFLVGGCAITAGLIFGVTPQTLQVAHIVLRALSSVLMGALVTMKTVLVADYMGTDAVFLVSGVSGFLLVPMLLCNPLLFGFFRDRMGSYDNLYRMIAGIIFSGGLAIVASLVRSSRSKSKIANIPDCEVKG
nr:monocarboxylate transporter 9-like [Rhipicephalus microplus]